MNVELKSGIEATRLLKRDPGKYLNRIKGLYILSAASLSPMSKFEEIKSSPIINQYSSDQLLKSKGDLEDLNLRLNSCPEWLTKRMCKALIKPMFKFIKDFQKTSKPG